MDRLALIQASSTHAFEGQGVHQQSPLPTGFNSGGVPGGNAHQQMDTLSQHTQVSINDQMKPPQGSRGPGLLQQNFPSVPHASVRPSSPPSASQPPPGPGPAQTLGDVPLPQLRALSTQLQLVVIEGEKNLQASSSWGEGDIQRQQLRAKIELNKQRLRALQEVINMKTRAR